MATGDKKLIVQVVITLSHIDKIFKILNYFAYAVNTFKYYKVEWLNPRTSYKNKKEQNPPGQFVLSKPNSYRRINGRFSILKRGL
jgi:hypothetical protein